MKRYIAIFALLALCLSLLPVTALAADTVTLNIADGAIIITATGYSVNGAAETPYTGSYIITGSANTTGPYQTLTVNGVADGSTVTLQNLSISTNGASAVTLHAPVKATGKLTLASSASAISGSNIEITGDAAITATSSAPAISGSSASIACASLDLDGSLGISAGTVAVNTTGNVRIKSVNPGISGSTTIKAGGNLVVESSNVCLSGSVHSVEVGGSIQLTASVAAPAITGNSASLKAGGDITLKSSSLCLSVSSSTVESGGSILLTTDGASPACNGSMNFKAAKNVTVTAGTSNALNGSAQSIDAGGNVTITNKSEYPTISATETTIAAGGKVNISNAGTGQAVVGTSFTIAKATSVSIAATAPSPTVSVGTTAINTTGDLTVTGSYMALSTTNLEMTAGGNMTVTGTGNAPTISTGQIAKLNATGNLTVQSNYMAFSTGSLMEATVGGNVKISSTANNAPLISCGDKNIIKAKGTVELTHPNFGCALSGAASEVEGSAVKITAGKGCPAISGDASLKATATDLTVISTDNQYPALSGKQVSLYAAEKISVKTANTAVTQGIPEMTFGHRVTLEAGGESMVIGLNRVAVEDGTDYLPLLKLSALNTPINATFTAKNGTTDVSSIKTAGTYACVATFTEDDVSRAASISIPFNLIVRKAKPAVTPATGDDAQLGLWMLLAMSSATALAGVHFGRKRFAR